MLYVPEDTEEVNIFVLSSVHSSFKSDWARREEPESSASWVGDTERP